MKYYYCEECGTILVKDIHDNEKWNYLTGEKDKYWSNLYKCNHCYHVYRFKENKLIRKWGKYGHDIYEILHILA